MNINRIIAELEELNGIPIEDGETLLFLDELQAAPEAITALRYFYEERPSLHVIGAGSLLEFALKRISSFGVGRISSLYMKPLSFTEFLSAVDETILCESLKHASPEHPLSDIAHEKLLSLYKFFLVVGGMPESVCRFAETGSILQARKVQQDIIDSLYDDFGKYNDEMSPEDLRLIMRFLLGRICEQFSYNKNSIPEMNAKMISNGIEILANTGIIYPVYSSTCDSLPISASINIKRMKPLFADTALYLSAAGLDVSEFTIQTDFRSLNIGNICELSAGLELLKAMTRDSDGTHRGTAEVDYVIQKGSSIIPVEVKARTQGGMKSLWTFLEKKTSEYGIRASLENFGMTDRLQIYPLYAIGNCLSRNKQ